MQFNKMRMVGLAAILLPFHTLPSSADEISEYYRGRTLTMIISSGVGGGYQKGRPSYRDYAWRKEGSGQGFRRPNQIHRRWQESQAKSR